MKKNIKVSDVSIEVIQERIFLIRGKKVMLDRDLAILYGVETFRLNEQVKRNTRRFPEDCMFQLTQDEMRNLISHFAISRWGGARKPPYAFTELGIAMLSSVLNSEKAIEVNLQIMRIFVKLRDLILTHKELAQKIQELELRVEGRFNIHDSQIISLFEKIRELLSMKEEDQKVKSPMGFPIKQTTQNKRKYDAAT